MNENNYFVKGKNPMNDSDTRILALVKSAAPEQLGFGLHESRGQSPLLVTPLTLIPLAAFVFCQAMGSPAKAGQPHIAEYVEAPPVISHYRPLIGEVVSKTPTKS